VNARGVLALTFVAGLVMVVAAIGTRRVVTLALALAALLAALCLPLTPAGSWLEPAALGITLGIAGLGVVVLVGWAGQPFLAPVALTGLAAYATAWFAGDQGQPLPIAVAYAMTLALVLGGVAGLVCAAQRSAAAVAIVSLGLAGVLDAAVFRGHALGGTRRLTPPVPRPVQVGGYLVDAGVVLYYGLLLLLLACFLGVLVLRDSRLRALLHAAGSRAREAEVRGVGVTAARLCAHLVAAALSGAAGCALALDTGRVAPATFAPRQSLLLVGLVLLLGPSRPVAGLAAGAVAGALPAVMSRGHPLAGGHAELLDLLTGGLLLVVLVGRELLGAWRAGAWPRAAQAPGRGHREARDGAPAGGLAAAPRDPPR
jgi:ABC-type branched-subunit amino acid transport system permease subunit